MSAISLILLAAAGLATALGGAALHTARSLHRQLVALRAQLAAAETARAEAAASAPATPAPGPTATVPAARQTPAEEIRTAVAEALAEERERELAEARAFWAAQEARDAGPDAGPLLAGHGTEYEVAPPFDHTLLEALLEGRLDGLEGLHEAPDGDVFVPRQPGPDAAADPATDLEPAPGAGGPDAEDGPGTGTEPESAELAAARRRHPSHPDFTLHGEPVSPAPVPAAGVPGAAEHERTVRRLAELADARTPLVDVRPGPLGTLDVYAFEDGTTMCMSPGHRETAERLAGALEAGLSPVLLGGSSVSGAYTLTFEFGEERIYALADRVIASL
ncbi:hypothetical protein [Streptomyces sp. JJ36]|uniref:hypothetical protein n=1 Tax=Streptomyces sp. JJ36 TaxID=2736645 RepID=UPI001F180E4D|nr:hypothetical protein [Streptomyces sp. JJ36]MCF6526083.1 hypothetical protein [Streptomyces sp. JJ36]